MNEKAMAPAFKEFTTGGGKQTHKKHMIRQDGKCKDGDISLRCHVFLFLPTQHSRCGGSSVKVIHQLHSTQSV